MTRSVPHLLFSLGLAVLLFPAGASSAQPAAPPGSAGATTARTGAARRAQRHRRPPRRHCTTPRSVAANYNGKYTGLLRRLYVPADCQGYGNVSDYGRHTGASYSGHQNLPAGYWVYHYPYWYIWRRRLPPAQHPRKQCRTPVGRSPSVAGKYQQLLRTVHAPGDCATYGSFQDYGHYAQASYAGHQNLPAGYWVYHYPHWYIWKRTSAPGRLPARVTCQTPKKRSANVGGKYRQLLRRITVPGDCAAYGEHYEYGPFVATSYGGHTGLPAGHWVYHYPHWYIWKQKR